MHEKYGLVGKKNPQNYESAIVFYMCLIIFLVIYLLIAIHL